MNEIEEAPKLTDIEQEQPECKHAWLGGGIEGVFQSVSCGKCGKAHPDNYNKKEQPE